MSANKLDRLIADAQAAEAPAPVPADMVQLTQVKLDGTEVAAYYFCGYMNWWPTKSEDPDLGPVPENAIPLYVKAKG